MTATVELSRAEMIEAVLKASRRPCPDIVAVNYLLCDDGVYRGPMGIPHGCTVVKPYVIQLQGYAYRDKHGVTFGTRMATEQAMRDAHEQRQDANTAMFRSQLDTMSDAKIRSQYECWVGGAR